MYVQVTVKQQQLWRDMLISLCEVHVGIWANSLFESLTRRIECVGDNVIVCAVR